MFVHNKDHHSADYSQIAECYRPGHADYTFDEKIWFQRLHRGGGRSSESRNY
ncbi:MAG: chorismate synthase [Eubacterium ventriosum]